MSSLARFVAVHRRGVVTAWITALIALAGWLLVAGTAFSDTSEVPESEATQALAVLNGGTASDATSGTIVWKSTDTDITDSSLVASMSRMLEQVSSLTGVTTVVSPYDQAVAGAVSPDENTAYATVVATSDLSRDDVAQIVSGYETDTLQIEIGGPALELIPSVDGVAESLGMLVALLLLFALFRAKRAALLPLATGVVGVASSLLAVMLASHVLDIPDDAITMGALIGLGVGIDYSLFIVHRHRSALMSGKTVVDSLAEALSSSGRAVIFAGATVMLALVGMFILGLPILTSMAICAAVTVLFTVGTALTLLPSLLAMLGTKALSRTQREELRIRGSIAPPARRRWNAWFSRVLRRPVVSIVAVLLVAGAIAGPLAQIHIGRADASADAAGTENREYFELVSAAFGDGFNATIIIVAETPDSASEGAFTELVADTAALDGVVMVTPAAAPEGVSAAYVTPSTTAQAEDTEAIVTAIRTELAPRESKGTAMHVYVSGATAINMDIASTLLGNLPLYLLVISSLGFLLLAVGFRSLVVPLTGVVTNLISIAVGIGAAVAIFQYGWGIELFGLGAGAPIIYLIPVLVAGLVFGLAMDYQVFLVSRMHEERERFGEHQRAIRVGGRESATVIAIAALIMASVFVSFAFSGDRIVAAMGVGLAVAVLFDAFLVRLVLVPALLAAIGRRTWAYPSWAERITPNASLEAPAEIEFESAPHHTTNAGATR